jgi:prolyl 4-hydroxylase
MFGRKTFFMTQKQFDDSWKIWIWSNVARGCSKDGIFKILHENGFDNDTIRKELNYELSGELDEIESHLNITNLDHNRFFVANSRKVDSDRIELYILEDFLTEDECQRLIELMKTNLRPSTITNENEPDLYFRTSKTCDFTNIKDPLSEEIDTRICRTLGINPSYSEGMQGQMYDVGEEFKPHTDCFAPGTEEFERYAGEKGQRTWTLMIYLNNVESGGETSFQNIGMMTRPKAGTAVFWNNLYPDGQPNPDTIHHALPVTAGYKAVITKWFRTNGTGVMNTKTDAELLPNFTKMGFKKLKLPKDIFQQVESYLNQNRHLEEKENKAFDYLSNDSIHPTGIIELPVSLKEQVAEAIKPLIEEWAGVEVAFTCVYGIRRYHRGTTLTPHRDRIETHILSAIVNIEQDVDEEWPLEIEDNYYRSHKVFLEPGEMVFYESARLLHGRMTPLKGDAFCNIFVHFTPASEDWKKSSTFS